MNPRDAGHETLCRPFNQYNTLFTLYKRDCVLKMVRGEEVFVELGQIVDTTLTIDVTISVVPTATISTFTRKADTSASVSAPSRTRAGRLRMGEFASNRLGRTMRGTTGRRKVASLGAVSALIVDNNALNTASFRCLDNIRIDNSTDGH